MPPAADAQVAAGRVRVFGGVLSTDRPLPGLPVASPGDGQFSFWELTTTSSAAAMIPHSEGAVVSGRQPYSNGVDVTLATGAFGPEIAISDTGRFTFAADGRRVLHVAPSDVDRGAVALDLIGVILPYVLHREGAWCVHASAVHTRDGVIAFIAPPGTGKSTLATACVQRGCALVADDVVVLRKSSQGITVTPTGLPLRLRADTARALGVAESGRETWGKVRVEGTLVHEALPLAAIYMLSPVAPDAAVERATRAPRAAALALFAHGKIAALLGADTDGDALTRCVDIAQRATVFDLAVPRDLARLGAMTDALLSWHNGAAA